MPVGKQVHYECGGGGCTPEGPFGDATCSDGTDNDCDGLVDSFDPDCQDIAITCSDYSSKNECINDLDCEWQGSKNRGTCVDATVCIPTTSNESGLCTDGQDNDCDGLIDAEDPDCQTVCTPTQEGPLGDPTCSDGFDNDCNGLTDANDPICQQTVVCSDITKKNECTVTADCSWDKSTRTCSDVP